MIFAPGQWSWSGYGSWIDRLIGRIENTSRHAEIFTPVGPNLAASQLHSWVWHAAAELWDQGHYREAVQKAATAVEEETQKRSIVATLAAPNCTNTRSIQMQVPVIDDCDSRRSMRRQQTENRHKPGSPHTRARGTSVAGVHKASAISLATTPVACQGRQRSSILPR